MSHLPQIKSDHRPILLRTKSKISLAKGRPFRFLARWTKHATFSSLVKDKWNFFGCMANSLSDLTMLVKNWNRSVYGFIGTHKRWLMNALSSIQKALIHTPSRLLQLKSVVRDELENLLDH